MSADADGSGRGARGTARWGRRRAVTAALTAAALLAALCLVLVAWTELRSSLAGPDASEPSCSWSADIRQANPHQAALIRCYLRAVARHSDTGLRAVARSADNGGPTGFTAADFAHSRDAATGTATATVVGNAVDSGDATVTIRYADGAQQQLEISMANPASDSSWRFWAIGSYPGDPNPPPSAAPR